MRLLLLLLLVGCTAGQGEGVVIGSLWIPGCDGDEPLGDEDAFGDGKDTFDLKVDYFAAKPVLDPDEDEETARDSLDIRLQHGAGNVEISDALTIQIFDVGEVSRGAAEEVRPDGGVRATLSLALRCPDAHESLQARSADTAGECPADGEFDLFSDDFDDPAALEDPFWEPDPQQPSCIVFADVGTDFGDEIVAAFYFNIRDGRAHEESEDRVQGYLRGRFRFTLERGAQSFP